MRSIPHPVAVITASDFSSSSSSNDTTADPSNTNSNPSPEQRLRGMTISSFNTVTLSPKPFVSFNIRTPSSTYDALISNGNNGTFLVHFLASTSAGARIADAFARGEREGAGVFAKLATGPAAKSEDFKIFVPKSGNDHPILAGDGVLRAVRCRLVEEKAIQVEDHFVVIAEVVGVVGQPGKREGLGLCYVDRAYRKVGEGIEIDEIPKVDRERIPGQSSEQDVEMQRTMGLNVRRGDEGR
ncbi:MAG: hypothetical protein Q9162_003564 [Coniocarpon cinnabarinum]